MKKLLCALLVFCSIVGLVACNGVGGDTNMHKIMQAICKDGTITGSDIYVYESAPETPKDANHQFLNENYKYVTASSSGTGYYKHYIHFTARNIVIVKDSYSIDMQIRFKWSAEDNVIDVEITSSTYNEWNTAKNKWKDGFGVTAEKITFDMNVYYNEGSYEYEDATYTFDEGNKNVLSNHFNTVEDGEKLVIELVVNLLNDALNGLNEIYTEKGYPIK